MRQKFLLVSVIFFLSFSALAQKKVVHQDLFWLKYSATYKINDQWSLNYFIEDRNYFEELRSNHFINTISATKKLKHNWSAGFGYMYFILSLPQDESLDRQFTRPEHRPFQFITHRQSLGEKWDLTQRYMAEQRFRRKTDTDGLVAGFDKELRFRYKTTIKYALSAKLDVVFYDEIMVHFSENIVFNVFDQNRASLGIDWKVAEKIKLGMSYIHWYQQQSVGDTFFQRNILTFAVQHSIN